jgi:hypothetical protein
MTLSTIACALQVVFPVVDQKWNFDVTVMGAVTLPEIPNLPKKLANPLARGELSFTNDRVTKKGQEPFTLSMKVKKNQSDLVSALSAGFQDSPIGPKNDKDNIYITHQFWVNQKDLTVEGDREASYDQPAQILNPFALGVAIMRRTMVGPELKKEYHLMTDGDRDFYAVFNLNFAAKTDPTKGEIAYRFDIVMKEKRKVYPNFFVGAIRANSITKKIEYIKASSTLTDGPIEVDDSLYRDVKSFVFNVVAK